MNIYRRVVPRNRKTKKYYRQQTFVAELSVNENELRSTKEDASECVNKTQKDAKNEVACDVTNYFNVSNVFECGRNNSDV